MQLSFSNIVILLGAFQGIFLSVVILNWQKGNKAANKFLSAFLFLFALQMIAFVVWDSRFILRYPHLSLVTSPFDFLLGPLFYLYAVALTQKEFRFKKIQWLHFALFIISIGYFTPFYLESTDYKTEFNLSSYTQFPPLWLNFSIVASLQAIVYIIVTILLLLQHERRIKKYYSSIEKIDLRWLRMIIFFICFIYISCSFISIIGYKWANYYSNIAFSIVIYAMGYYGMKYPPMFMDIREEINTSEPIALIEEKTEEIKYEKSGLTQEKSEAILSALDNLMQNEKLYLNSELSLQQLADKLQTSIHHLSQVLNQIKKQNFFDYINQLRVEEFKKQCANPSKQSYSILGLALDCGFNSKAAFNTAFKKYTGITPSEFRKQFSN